MRLRFLVLATIAVACSNDGTRDGGKDAGSGGAASSGGAVSSGGTRDAADASPDPSWNGCPDGRDAARDPTWPHALVVKDSAVYCSTFGVGLPLKDGLLRKAMLRVAPGIYRLPAASRTGVHLPSCFRFGEGDAPYSGGDGAVTYTADAEGDTPAHEYLFVQSVPSPGGPRTLGADLTSHGKTPAFVLDGVRPPLSAPGTHFVFQLCPAGGDCIPSLVFGACAEPSAPLNRHAVTFAGGAGAVTFEVRIVNDPSTTAPTQFARASGTYHGTAFDQRSYWKLVYSPEHHHFIRAFAVLFDQPIDGACGLVVEGLEPFGDDSIPDVAAAVDCTLNPETPLGVETHVLTLDG